MKPDKAPGRTNSGTIGDGTAPPPLVRFLTCGLIIGFVAGTCEGTFYAIRDAVSPIPDWAFSIDTVWMVPVVTGLLLALAALPLALLHARFSRLFSLGTATIILTWLAAFPVVRVIIASMHPVAAAVLAAGIAVVTSRFLAGRRRAWVDSWKMASGLLALAVLAGVTVQATRLLVERRALAHLREAQVGSPNVLLLVLDTVRGLDVGLSGYPRKTTPEIDAVADESIVFEQAIAPSPWTLPSHASLFTGRHPHELSTDWQRGLDGRFPTLAEALAQRGYVTAGFVANLYYASRQFGLDRGFIHYDDLPLSIGIAIRRSRLATVIVRRIRRLLGKHQLLGRKSVEDISAAFLSWLDKGHEDRPFFAFLNYYDAHEPYRPPAPWDRLFTDQPIHHLDPWETHQDQALVDYQAAYDGAIAYVDHHVGELFRELEQRGLLDRTIVLITSDHGEEFGEHDVIDHGNSLYYPSIHVPLVLRVPAHLDRIRQPQRVAQPVSLRDIPATVMDLLALGQGAGLGGNSLIRLIESGSTPALDSLPEPVFTSVTRKPWTFPDWFPISAGDMASVLLDGYHYIRNGDGREEIYDVRTDPLEQNDLAPAMAASGALERFRTLMQRLPQE